MTGSGAPIFAANVPKDLHWNYLRLMLVIAVLIFLVRKGRGAKGADGREQPRGLLEYLVPRDIYTHVSARVDVWLWVFERALAPVWGLLLGSLGPFIEKSIIGALTACFGADPSLEPNLAWLFAGSLVAISVFNVGLFALLFGFNGAFRHYHVKFHYPPWLAKWLQSPAMHHTHHSYLPQHWDTNMGPFTSNWYRMLRQPANNVAIPAAMPRKVGAPGRTRTGMTD